MFHLIGVPKRISDRTIDNACKFWLRNRRNFVIYQSFWEELVSLNTISLIVCQGSECRWNREEEKNDELLKTFNQSNQIII